MKLVMKMPLVTSNLSAIRTPLLQALVEIWRYSFGPLVGEKSVSARTFVDSAGTLASTVHELRGAMSDVQMLRFLDDLFVPFLPSGDS
jgi:hypothetical protein